MKLILAIILNLCFSFAYAQKVDKKYIDDWIKISGQHKLIKSNTLYVVDGIPYQEADSAFFNKLLVKNIAGLFVLTDTSSIFNFISDVILIQTKGLQSKKEKIKLFEKAKAKLVDEYFGFSNHILVDSKDPVLMINDKVVHATESKLMINKLNLRNIYAITVYSSKFDPAYFGQNAKNGLVQIWTYPKKK